MARLPSFADCPVEYSIRLCGKGDTVREQEIPSRTMSKQTNDTSVTNQSRLSRKARCNAKTLIRNNAKQHTATAPVHTRVVQYGQRGQSRLLDCNANAHARQTAKHGRQPFCTPAQTTLAQQDDIRPCQDIDGIAVPHKTAAITEAAPSTTDSYRFCRRTKGIVPR